MDIIVTQTDIYEGECHPASCPIALAAKRRLPGSNPRVGRSLIRLFGTTYTLPTEAATFAANFDAGLRVEPFRFSLPLEAQHERRKA